jgi:hypothetical protein
MGNPDIFDYQLGLASGSMTKLEVLAVSGSVVNVDYPKSTFLPYADEQDLVSGLVRGVGFPTCTWIWGVITRVQRDALRSYCPGKSAAVCIRTKTMDSSDSYHTYSAIMVWPTKEEERDVQSRIQLKITFKTMVLIS